MTRLAALLLALTLAPGCATAPVADAEGLFVRILRVRTAPAHTKRFEALMERCVAVAAASRGDVGRAGAWLCYKEPPGRYWVVSFSETRDGFAFPPTLAGFVSALRGHAAPEDGAEMASLLGGLEHETEWEVLLRQRAAWSTVPGIDPSVHPKARLMQRTVRPGHEAAFAAALTARTAFFAERDYPLPIEGFVTLEGDTRQAYQVVFARDWPSFHAAESFPAFVKSLPSDEQDAYAARKAALMTTMSRAEFHDASVALELSHAPSG